MAEGWWTFSRPQLILAEVISKVTDGDNTQRVQEGCNVEIQFKFALRRGKEGIYCLRVSKKGHDRFR